MAANRSTSPIAPDKPRNEQIKASTANTNRDGTGTITDLFTGGSLGSVVNRVGFVHAGASGAASTAMVVRLWKKRSSTYRLIEEKALPAVTPSVSVIQPRFEFTTTDILLADSTDVLAISVSVAEAVDVTAEGGDF